MVNQLTRIIIIAALLHGCAPQILNEHIQKGMLVREEPSGRIVHRSRTRTIELLSPCSALVGERVEQEEDTSLYYQKLLVRVAARPREYPYLDAYFKLLLSTAVIPVFTPTYWVEGSYAGPDCSAAVGKCVSQEVLKPLTGQYFVEGGTRVKVVRTHLPEPGQTVSIFINGYYKGDIPVGRDAVVSLALPQLPELANPRKDVKITFKYFDAYAYAVIKRTDMDSVQRSCRTGNTPVRPGPGAGAS